MNRSTSVDHHTGSLFTLTCLIIILAGMKAAAPILNPLLLSMFIAILCWPFLRWMETRGVHSGIAVTLVISGLLIILTILGVYVASSINQFTKALPSYQANLLQQTAGMVEWLYQYGLTLPEGQLLVKDINAGKVMMYAGVLLSGLSGVFANILFILLTVLFLLFETYSLPKKMQRAFGETSKTSHYGEIFDSINRYMGIKVITSLVTGLIITTWLAVLDVDFPILWGVLAFILNFVPNIGSIIAAIPAVLLALVQLGGNTALYAALGYLAVNIVVGNIWEPKIMGNGLGLSTLVVFLSLVFWGWIFGTVGMLLSVPFTMIAKIVLENNEQTHWIAILLGTTNDLQEKPLIEDMRL